jgi:proteasome lid subunit RPN8/RPN11
MRIPAQTIGRIFGQCLTAYPNEACGVIARRAGGENLSVYGIRNVARDPRVTFETDPCEQMAAWGRMDARNENPVIAFHSHVLPVSVPKPSRNDIEYHDRDMLMLIVCLRDPTRPTMALWKVEEERTLEIPISYL